MTETLEQELEQLIASEDYRVVIWAGDRSLNLTLLYIPKLVVKPGFYANGKISEAWFRGRRRWPKAKKWVQREIAGHRALLKAVSQA